MEVSLKGPLELLTGRPSGCKVYDRAWGFEGCMFARVTAWFHAVGAARKHFVNWPELVVSAFLGRGGVYRSRGGGVISCDAKTLLRRFVRMEYVWRLHGDTLPTVRFEDDSMIIPNYFGRDFRVPLNMELVSPPSIYLKAHPYDVAGLPGVCINASLAVQLPYDPTKEGLISYGLWDDVDDSLEMLDVPVVQLTKLVEKYRPTVVKLNCEGCEHYALDHLSQLPQLGVKKISVQFHGIKGHDPYESLSFLEKKLGMSVKVGEGEIRSLLGRKVKSLFAYWLF
jgi:hypothetical protein